MPQPSIATISQMASERAVSVVTKRCSDISCVVALRQLTTGVLGILLVDHGGRIVELNAKAEDVIRREDGLAVRQGRIGALRAFENARLATLVTAATKEAAIGRMAVARRGGPWPYLLTVAPFQHDRADRVEIAAILVGSPDELLPTMGEVSEFFGLTPAESRLATCVMAGKNLQEFARERRVQVSTLRTQLRSVLRKVGVGRQVDLVRVLSTIPLVSVRAP